MLSVNIVFKGHWILERLATELLAIPGVELNTSGWPPREATSHDVLYCLPGANIRHFPTPPQNPIRIGFFTHGRSRTEDWWHRYNVHLAMNQTMAKMLFTLGAPDPRVIYPGTDIPYRPITFGVNCRAVEGAKPKGRKGLDIVKAAVAAGYSFVGCSPDPQNVWPCPITHHPENRRDFYSKIDYLVVTSREEGGPMVVPEALAHGVPVIAPNVGWCWEFPSVIRYEAGAEGLLTILKAVTSVPTWPAWVQSHRELLAELEAMCPH